MPELTLKVLLPGVSLCSAGTGLAVNLATVLVLPTPLFPETNILYWNSSGTNCGGKLGLSRQPKSEKRNIISYMAM